jgi:hypothetical protein
MVSFSRPQASGSFLAVSHATADFHPLGAIGPAVAVYQKATAPFVPRPLDQVAGLFNGFDLVELGLVQAPLCHPDGRRPSPKDLAKIAIYAGVGQKGTSQLVTWGWNVPSSREPGHLGYWSTSIDP